MFYTLESGKFLGFRSNLQICPDKSIRYNSCLAPSGRFGARSRPKPVPVMKEFLYSRNAVYETLRARRRQVFQLLVADGAQDKGRMAEILKLAGERKIKVERVPRARLDKVHAEHQGVVLEAGSYPYSDLLEILEHARQRGEAPLVLLLDSLNDPHNFGALLRSGEAIGVHGVILPLAHTVEVTPAVVNASSGASEYMRVARSNLSQAIDALKEEEVWIVGLDQTGAEVEAGSRHLRGALGLVIGSEGEGIRPLVRSKCDILLKLPMRGHIESLNAAVAGSVALYLAYLARQQ
jgi:23S rRNA (guanosine2251-2'-O)-methyltransferase